MFLCTSNYPGSDLATVGSGSSTPSTVLTTSDHDDNNQPEARDRPGNSPSTPTQVIDGGRLNTLEFAKGKAKMCIADEEFARSLVAEDALAEFDEYRRIRQLYEPTDETDELFREFFKERAGFNPSSIFVAELFAAWKPEKVDDIRRIRRRPSDDAEEGQEEEESPITIRTSGPSHRILPMPPLFSREERDDQVMCVACRCTITGKVIRLECGSKYDTECIKHMFEANVNDEYRFPPRCCGEVVPLSIVEDQLSKEMRDLYKAKIEEYSTPSRLYCSNTQCAKFLGPRQARAASISCGSCGTETCALCTAPAHDASQKCKVDKGMRKALKLGQSNGWQRCPRCRQLVERNDGCYHMSCRCGAQFCYLCAGNWGSCKCWQRRRAFLKILLFRWLHLRGNYLVNGEPAANSGNAVTRICKQSWKNVKKVVTPQAERTAALREKVEVGAV